MSNPLRSLATRITLVVFLSSLLSSLTVTWISVQSLHGFVHSKIDQRFPQIGSRVLRDLDDGYRQLARELAVFARSPILQGATPHFDKRGRSSDLARKEAEQYLRDVLDSFPQFERLLVSNRDGDVLLKVGPGDSLGSGTLGSLTGQSEASSISDAHLVEGVLVQITSSPMHDAQGRSIGRLHATIDLDRLVTTLGSDELGEDTTISIID
jgi:hypothetical protein